MTTSGDDHRSRRQVLRAGGATVATALSGLGAGCSGLPPLGTAVRYGSVSVPAAQAPAFRDWLPAPSAFPDDTEASDGYNAWVYAPPAGDSPAWVSQNVGRELLAIHTDYVGFHVDDAEIALLTDGSAVLAGDVDRAAVRETLADTSYEPDGSHAGYEVYTHPDRERTVGVGREAVVFGRGSTPRQNLTVTVDAKRGEVPLYHERNSDFADLTSSTGMRRWGWIVSGGITTGDSDDILNDTVGWATQGDYDDDHGYYVMTWLFPEGYDLTAGKVKSVLKQKGRATEAAAVDVDVTGRTATIAMRLSFERSRDDVDQDALVPYATFRVTYDPDSDQLTVHHVAGDPIPVEHLEVRPAEAELSLADVGETVTPGERLTVDTSDMTEETTVLLTYDPDDTDTSASLIDYELP